MPNTSATPKPPKKALWSWRVGKEELARQIYRAQVSLSGSAEPLKLQSGAMRVSQLSNAMKPPKYYITYYFPAIDRVKTIISEVEQPEFILKCVSQVDDVGLNLDDIDIQQHSDALADELDHMLG